jgi:hypothetical protein
MTIAMVKVFSTGKAAAEEVKTLTGPGLDWHVVYSGPDDGVTFRDGDTDATLATSAKGWVVLAVRSGITPG